MLAVFEKAVGNPPEELGLPSVGSESKKTRAEIMEAFRSLRPESTLYCLSNGNFMALSSEVSPAHPRSIFILDDIFCIFIGTLENMSELKRHYGLSRHSSEAMVVVEAYKVLRDRAPYPPDQVIRDLQGKFAFFLFDAKSRTLFAARDREGKIEFNWGMAGDGSLVCSDDPKIMQNACGNSCAPFPPGCIFMNVSGLTSFDHPLYKVRAVPREDNDGKISEVVFQVDMLTRIPSIPRSGSATNWADTTFSRGE